jgi:hypothetical protein
MDTATCSARLQSEVEKLQQQIAAASSSAAAVAELAQAQSSQAASELAKVENEVAKLQQLLGENKSQISLLQTQTATQQQQLQEQASLLAGHARERDERASKKQCVVPPAGSSASGTSLGRTHNEVILEFVFPGWLSASDYIFLASVSSEWRRRMLKKCYDNFKLKEVAAKPKTLFEHIVEQQLLMLR